LHSRSTHRPPTSAALRCFSFLSSSSPSPPRDLPSFPTRRSSDLKRLGDSNGDRYCICARHYGVGRQKCTNAVKGLFIGVSDYRRSEEHTSELQSRFDLVCRLLLEKKKKYVQGRHTRVLDHWHSIG